MADDTSTTNGNRRMAKEDHHGVTHDDDCTASISSSEGSLSSLPSLPQDAEEVHKSSTADCPLLERTKIPPFVKKIGWMAFYQFTSLVEVSFGANPNNGCCQLREISSCAFMDCCSLQVVSLPDSLEKISYGAFGSCINLTTVTMPVAKRIWIKAFAFRKCKSLSNIVVSPNSVIDQRSFEGCSRLQECLGSLNGRFDRFPIHKLCYHASTTTVDELQKAMDTFCMGDDNGEEAAVDMFGMTPFHVLASSAEPRRDLFQVLLQNYQPHVLGWKDANDKRAMDYLATNFTRETAWPLEMALRVWMIGPLERWGATGWSIDMNDQVNTLLLANNGMEKRTDLLRKVCSKMEDYERNESLTLLELAVWKKELQGHHHGDKKIEQKRRSATLNLCGSYCVLSNVAPFLGVAASMCTPRDHLND